MEVMVAVQSGTLLHALRVQLKRRVPARRGEDYNEVPQVFETGPEGPELDGQQKEIKSKAAQTKPKKLIRRTCPSGHGSDCSCPKRHHFHGNSGMCA